MAVEDLPPDLTEAIYEIEAMANEEGQDRLEKTIAGAGTKITIEEESTCAEIALQVWMGNRRLFARAYQESQFARVSSFDYFGCGNSPQPPWTGIPDRTILSQMESNLDAWFKAHNRGERTTRIVAVLIGAEIWFQICHGSTYTRVRTTEPGGNVSVQHFRPAKDDLVVLNTTRNEIRIHARSAGERTLYQQTWGRHLCGDPLYFSERRCYTLEPLRLDGASALRPDGITGITKIILRELEWGWKSKPGEFVRVRAEDYFKARDVLGSQLPTIPETATILGAIFDFYFESSIKPRKVHIRCPNKLKLSRRCDATLVHHWMKERGFVVKEAEELYAKVMASA